MHNKWGGRVRFIFSEKLYSDGFSEKKLKTVRSQITYGKIKIGIYLITLPLVEDGILEIYWYPQFLQPEYRKIKQEAFVVGIAKSKEDAFSLVERIVKDVGVSDNRLLINDYFKGWII